MELPRKEIGFTTPPGTTFPDEAVYCGNGNSNCSRETCADARGPLLMTPKNGLLTCWPRAVPNARSSLGSQFRFWLYMNRCTPRLPTYAASNSQLSNGWCWMVKFHCCE